MNKIDIFKDLSVNDLRSVDGDKYSTILGDYYGQFTDFCNFIQDQCVDSPDLKHHIEGLSCSIDDTGAEFSVSLDTGDTKTIHFDDPSKIVNKGEGKIVYRRGSFPTIQEIEDRENEKERLEAEAITLKAAKRSRRSQNK